MYYNINTKEIINTLPPNITLDNGTIVSLSSINNDINFLSDLGIYTVQTDSPEQPPNSIEDVSARIIDLNKPYVNVTRVWLSIPIEVPQSISARQVRLWLIDNNISLTSVEAAINTIVDEKLREKTRVEWEYAPYIERNHPLINSLSEFLGLTPEQIDNGFITASTL
jgi:hypothetical protein